MKALIKQFDAWQSLSELLLDSLREGNRLMDDVQLNVYFSHTLAMQLKREILHIRFPVPAWDDGPHME